METLVLDGRQTIVLAILVLFLGKLLTSKIAFLRKYNIPEPVSGGLIASIVFGYSNALPFTRKCTKMLAA